MNKSKNFNLFLIDGEVTGRIKCALANWNGLAYKIPKFYLEKCKDRQHLKQSGIYFLFGKMTKKMKFILDKQEFVRIEKEYYSDYLNI